jgi:hypothetical protein
MVHSILHRARRSAVTRGQGWLNLGPLLLGCCFVWQAAGTTANAQENRHVLVLYEQGVSYPAVTLTDHEIRSVLEKQSNYHIDLDIEYMLGTDPVRDPASEQRLSEWYVQKYRDEKPDVIIAGGRDAIRFIVNAHEK